MPHRELCALRPLLRVMVVAALILPATQCATGSDDTAPGALGVGGSRAIADAAAGADGAVHASEDVSSPESVDGGDEGATGEAGDQGDGDADGSDDAADAASGSNGCGTRSGMRGQTFRTLTVDGTSRTYYAYLPSSVGGTTPAALVFVMHGATMNATDMITITGYEGIADSDGIAVAFLDGQDTDSMTSASTLDPWNVSDDGAGVCGAGALANNPTAEVDFDFMDAVKADIAEDQCLDADHIFATGFSMGGYFSHHVGCDRTDIRAVGPHSGGTIAGLGSYRAGHVPVIIFHGTADPLIASGCDDPNGSAQLGFTASATLWAQKNGCQTTYQTLTETGTGGNEGQCYLYDGCPSDGQVELCTFTGLGHAWAGAADCPGCIGTGADYPSATALEWTFFKKYAW
jgi:polyhydroxybutyrate depolymerase